MSEASTLPHGHHLEGPQHLERRQLPRALQLERALALGRGWRGLAEAAQRAGSLSLCTICIEKTKSVPSSFIHGADALRGKLGPAVLNIALQHARRKKERRYPELQAAEPHRLVVLPCEVGGRWGCEAVELVKRFAPRPTRAACAARLSAGWMEAPLCLFAFALAPFESGDYGP